MPGFFISNYLEDFELNNEYPDTCVNQTIGNSKFSIKRNTLDKFMDDKLFVEDDDYIIVIEGVVLNKKQLSNRCSWLETVKNLIIADDEHYFDSFRGSFSGAHYDKKSNKWIIYNDALGIKPLYYYHNDGKWIVASEIRYITQALHRIGVEYHPDEDASYDILSYGFMTSDATLVKEIKKLPYGSYAVIDDTGISIRRYFDFNYCEKDSVENEEELIERLDILFKESVRLQFEKDAEYGYAHIATLSGGLDSRMTIWAASEMGYPVFNFTFGQANCMDIQVATKVAKYLNSQFMINTLDNGDMLLAYESVVKMNSGQSLYSGIAHSFLSLEKINFQKYGILHTGDLGDAIVGVISTKKEGKYPGAYSTKLAGKSKSVWDGKENVEKYKMRTRGFLGVGASKAVCENFVYCSSPFMNRDFFTFCLQEIPYDLRKQHNIYEKWVIKKYPQAAQIPLQRYNGGLMTENKLMQMMRKIKRIGIGKSFEWVLYKLKLKKSLSRKIVKTSMNPLDVWFDDPTLGIKEKLDAQLRRCTILINDNSLISQQLYDDINNLYHHGNTTEKTQAITVAEALVQLFLQQ